MAIMMSVAALLALLVLTPSLTSAQAVDSGMCVDTCTVVCVSHCVYTYMYVHVYVCTCMC